MGPFLLREVVHTVHISEDERFRLAETNSNYLQLASLRVLEGWGVEGEGSDHIEVVH